MRVWWSRSGHQTLRGTLVGWVVRSGEGFGDAADPVSVYVMEGRIDEGGIFQVEEFGFDVEAENLYPSR